jgi:hypothetical protein
VPATVQLDAIATLMLRTLIRTGAPIFNRLIRMVEQLAFQRLRCRREVPLPETRRRKRRSGTHPRPIGTPTRSPPHARMWARFSVLTNQLLPSDVVIPTSSSVPSCSKPVKDKPCGWR